MSAVPKIEQLRSYGIDPKEILTIDGQPWLSADQLFVIARKSGDFQSISAVFDRLEGDQVIYLATVADKEGRTYSRTGVATIGETLKGASGPVQANAYTLAESRALRSALASAGFDLFKSGSVVPLREARAAADPDPGFRRNEQIKLLHVLAAERGLIVQRAEGGTDRSMYRAWLEEEFDVTTSAGFTEEQFAIAINKLKLLPLR